MSSCTEIHSQFIYSAVSRKVVQQKCTSVRENTERYIMGSGSIGEKRNLQAFTVLYT